MNMASAESIRQMLQNVQTIRRVGRVTQTLGLVIESDGPPAQIGEICEVRTDSSKDAIAAEVVGFRETRLLLMPLGSTQRIQADSRVVATGRTMEVPVGPQMLGRVFDGLGEPADGREPISPADYYPAHAQPPPAMSRRRITEVLPLGIRSIDGTVTCGRGQRMGIFSGSGVGKSTLLGMIARNTRADVNVIALIGERGREVNEFIDEALGPEGLQRSVIVAATSDKPPLVRLNGAYVATAIAEYFRDRGADVLLMMDSITRFAWAQREVGLAIGEPPTRNGYTPSVFARLPELLERAGMSDEGSITGLYTVLVDGDDMREPVADAVRSILDGHIVLSRDLATRNHYPPVDVLESISRLMEHITSDDHQDAAGQLRQLIADYDEAEDLINLGAYEDGSNPDVDRAIALRKPVLEFLQQQRNERTDFEQTVATIEQIVS
ncbi:MAG: flagellar protein export ATPase FliI [Armatimonadota bacterium]